MNQLKPYETYPDNPMTKPVAKNAKNFNSFRSSWTIEVIDAPGAWLIPTTTSKVTIGVVDSGLNTMHRDLKGLKVVSAGDIKDNTGHGTAVIGVFGAQHNTGTGMAGVSPSAEVLLKKVDGEIQDSLLSYFNNDQMSKRCKEALNEIYNETINNSSIKIVIFAISSKECKSEKDAEDFSAVYYHEVIEKLLKKDIIVILGGDNEDVPIENCYPAMMKKKLLSTYKNLLIVSSCHKPTVGIWEGDISECYPKQTLADLLAPGSSQVTLSNKGSSVYNIPNGKNTSGNSLAIPHVAGVAALLFEINPHLTGRQVCEIIVKSSEVQTSGVKVVNAFAAALNAYNHELINTPLYGYRFILPSGYEGGILEIDGKYLVEIVSVRFLGLTAFCRFVSKEEKLSIRVFPPIYDNNGNYRISNEPVWVGTTEDIVKQADKSSKESAWVYNNCQFLKTIRLQGLSVKIFEGNNPLENRTIILKKDKTMFKGITDTYGHVNIPFGEPGTYSMTFSDTNNLVHELFLELEKNNIYEFDPRDTTGLTKRITIQTQKDNVDSCWAGEISVEGQGELKNSEFINASGKILLKCTRNKIDKKVFLDNCYDGYFGGIPLEECIEEWGEDFADDDLPDLNNIKIRAFSEILCKLDSDFTIEDDYYYFEDYIIEYQDGSDIPKGFIISEDGTYNLNLPKIINRLIDVSFKKPDNVYYPFVIDITFAWFVQNKMFDDGTEFTMTYLTEHIEPYEIPIERTYTTDGKKIKLTAGPCKSPMKFVTDPSNAINVVYEEKQTDNYISAVIDFKNDNNLFIYVIGEKGEVGRIDL